MNEVDHIESQVKSFQTAIEALKIRFCAFEDELRNQKELVIPEPVLTTYHETISIEESSALDKQNTTPSRISDSDEVLPYELRSPFHCHTLTEDRDERKKPCTVCGYKRKGRCWMNTTSGFYLCFNCAKKEETPIFNYEQGDFVPKDIIKVVIDPSVKTLPDRIFEKRRCLQSVQLPPSLKIIGKYAFCDCMSLQTIYIPDSVVKLGKEVFGDCINLTTVRLSDNLKTIPYNTFMYCNHLKTINIPSSVSVIGEGAFNHCSELENVNGVTPNTSINNTAFDKCFSLKSKPDAEYCDDDRDDEDSCASVENENVSCSSSENENESCSSGENKMPKESRTENETVRLSPEKEKDSSLNATINNATKKKVNEIIQSQESPEKKSDSGKTEERKEKKPDKNLVVRFLKSDETEELHSKSRDKYTACEPSDEDSRSISSSRDGSDYSDSYSGDETDSYDGEDSEDEAEGKPNSISIKKFAC